MYFFIIKLIFKLPNSEILSSQATFRGAISVGWGFFP